MSEYGYDKGSPEWLERYQEFLQSLEPALSHSAESVNTEEIRDNCENALLVSMMMIYPDPVEQTMMAHLLEKHQRLMCQFGMTCISVGHAMASGEKTGVE